MTWPIVKIRSIAVVLPFVLLFNWFIAQEVLDWSWQQQLAWWWPICQWSQQQSIRWHSQCQWQLRRHSICWQQQPWQWSIWWKLLQRKRYSPLCFSCNTIHVCHPCHSKFSLMSSPATTLNAPASLLQNVSSYAPIPFSALLPVIDYLSALKSIPCPSNSPTSPTTQQRAVCIPTNWGVWQASVVPARGPTSSWTLPVLHPLYLLIWQQAPPPKAFLQTKPVSVWPSP